MNTAISHHQSMYIRSIYIYIYIIVYIYIMCIYVQLFQSYISSNEFRIQYHFNFSKQRILEGNTKVHQFVQTFAAPSSLIRRAWPNGLLWTILYMFFSWCLGHLLKRYNICHIMFDVTCFRFLRYWNSTFLENMQLICGSRYMVYIIEFKAASQLNH